MEEHACDLLIIGGGIAAACAAVEAAVTGLRVTLVDKGRLGSSGSSPTGAGFAAAYLPAEYGGDEGDGPEQQLADILDGGRCLARTSMAKLLVQELGDNVRWLDALGAPYARDQLGRYQTSQGLGESYPRVAVVDGGGPALMQFLRREVLHRGVRVIQDTMIERLFFGSNGRIGAALGLRVAGARPILFQFGAAVLASGSATGLYPFHTANFTTTGDSYALALQLGARLMNMEFIEFTIMPTPGGIPISTGGSKPTIAAGAKLFNALGERFMARVDPENLERTNRSTLVRGVARELLEGRGPCYMDASSLESPTRPLRRVKSLLNVHYSTTRIEWSPGVHTFLGGVYITTECETGIPGLYAAGEAAGHGGLFGADRAGGAIGASQLLGRRSGRNAAYYVLDNPLPARVSKAEVEEHVRELRRFGDEKGRSVDSIRADVQLEAWDGIGVIRAERSLERACRRFEELWRERPVIAHTDELISALETRNLALVGRLVSTAALLRTESRGQHFRDDYPETDDLWHKRIFMRMDDGDLVHEVVDVNREDCDDRLPGRSRSE